jgi:hypothetical protein
MTDDKPCPYCGGDLEDYGGQYRWCEVCGFVEVLDKEEKA